jgi:5-methylcytosine-specific restriction endonuclease McrA
VAVHPTVSPESTEEKLRRYKREWMRSYRLRHPGKSRLYLRKWRAANRKRYNLQAAAYQRAHRKRKPHLYRAQDLRKLGKIYADPQRLKQFHRRKRERLRRYRQRHPERIREFSRRAYEIDGGEYQRKWRKLNPLKKREQRTRRRARKMNASGSHTLAEWIARVRLYRWRCAYCRKRVTLKTLTQDHMIPLSKGGSDFASNLVPACRSCNSRKNAKLNWNPARVSLGLA